MRALPVEVVRALIAIVDNRGFTRAAEQLGRTQPTISLQIRRLEELIGGSAFDNTSRLTLTARGRTVLDHGRKLVAAHDELVAALKRGDGAPAPVRLGMPNEFASALAPRLVDLANRRGQFFAFEVTCDQSEALISSVRANQLDVALAMTAPAAAEDSVAHWPMPLSWIAAPQMQMSPQATVRLVTPPEGSLFHSIASGALARAGRRFEIVCTSANPDVLRSAVEAGYGVCVAPRPLAPENERLPEALLAPLPEVTLGLYARAGEQGASPAPLLAHMIALLEASPALGIA